MTRDDDPTPAMALLWGTSVAGQRGPARALDIATIVDAAVRIADTKGFDAISMRNVAAMLGIGAASLYTYVPSKEQLFALMLDAAIGKGKRPHEYSGTWRQKFEAWARDDWRAYRTHPWALQLASVRPLAGPNALAWLESALRVLAGIGLQAEEMMNAVQGIDTFVRGHARAVAADEGFLGARRRRPDRWRKAQGAFLEQHVNMAGYPTFARVAAAGGFSEPEKTFEFGLARLLDGIEALIESRGR